jgi:hypothetical protein
MVEPRRKHGAFDPRYPLLSKPVMPTWVLRADGGLEWTAFLARFFPGRRRHDIEALAAYGAYRSPSRQPSSAGNESPAPTSPGRSTTIVHRPKRLQPTPVPRAATTRRVPVTAPSAAVSVWEGEGGAGGASTTLERGHCSSKQTRRGRGKNVKESRACRCRRAA